MGSFIVNCFFTASLASRLTYILLFLNNHEVMIEDAKVWLHLSQIFLFQNHLFLYTLCLAIRLLLFVSHLKSRIFSIIYLSPFLCINSSCKHLVLHIKTGSWTIPCSKNQNQNCSTIIPQSGHASPVSYAHCQSHFTLSSVSSPF